MPSMKNEMGLKTRKDIIQMRKRKTLKGKFADRMYGQILLEIPKHLLKVTLIAVFGSFIMMLYIIGSDQELNSFLNIQEEVLDFTHSKVHPMF